MKRGLVVVIALLSLTLLRIYAEEPKTYLGAKQCSPCHSELDTVWQKTRHAKAIESLKKSKQEMLPACVRCHVTAYEQEGGFIDYDLTPEMAGVQCESCHGPGSVHAADPSADMIKNPGPELCRQCHTAAQDPGFKYEEKMKEVHSAAHG